MAFRGQIKLDMLGEGRKLENEKCLLTTIKVENETKLNMCNKSDKNYMRR
jgi:hypothetical protein